MALCSGCRKGGVGGNRHRRSEEVDQRGGCWNAIVVHLRIEGKSLYSPIFRFPIVLAFPFRIPQEPVLSSRGVISNLRIVSACTLLSRILGLARDMALAAMFGGGPTLDAFIVAFRLPNLARQLFGEGALTTAFLPVFVRDIERNGQETARQTLSAIALTVAGLLAAIVLVGEAFIWGMLSLGTVSAEVREVLELLGLLLPYMLFICLAALLSAALHSLRQFLWPSLVPVVLNVVWLLGLLLAWVFLDSDLSRVQLICVTIVVAGVLQFLLPLVVLSREGWWLTRHCPEGWLRVREVFMAMLPVVAGVGLTQVGAVFDSVIAWAFAQPEAGSVAACQRLGFDPILETGTASALYLGQRLYQFPLGVFGVALGTVLFPVLTRFAELKDFQGLRNELTRGLQLVVAVALPASAGLFLLAEPVTSLLFRHGRFDAADTRLAAAIVATYGSAVWVYISLLIINRAFYAVGDRQTPMRFGLVALLVNVVLNLTLIWFLGGVGLALGGVLAAGTQLLLSLRRLESRLGRLRWSAIGWTSVRVAVATIAMGVTIEMALWLVPRDVTVTHRLTRLLIAMVCGTGVFLIACRFLQISEIWSLMRSDLAGREYPDSTVDEPGEGEA